MLLCALILAAVAVTVPVLAAADDPTGSRSADELALATAQADALRAQLAAERRTARAMRLRAAPDVDTRRDVERAIAVAAAAYGVPAARLRRVAFCESTLNPAATNGRYAGLFQFGLPLWRTTPYARFSRTDPYAASLAAAWAFRRGMASHWPVCGRR